MRDSFIFYRSFYEAVKDLPRDIRGEVYTAIMEYGLNGITTENLKPLARSIFTLVKPVIDYGNKQYINGLKGGRPRKEETKTKNNDNPTETQPKPNRNPTETLIRMRMKIRIRMRMKIGIRMRIRMVRGIPPRPPLKNGLL